MQNVSDRGCKKSFHFSDEEQNALILDSSRQRLIFIVSSAITFHWNGGSGRDDILLWWAPEVGAANRVGKHG